jgi:hypothetical protein
MRVHSVLPDAPTDAIERVLAPTGLGHVAHRDEDPVAAAVDAASDESAIALIGPFRSADVREAVAASAPARLPLLAPVATWAGVTRDDEPGCDDPARHAGTVFRLVARDTEVAVRIAADIRRANQRALVIAGEHEYGRQLDGQLRLGALPRAQSTTGADVVVFCGLAGAPEVEQLRRVERAPVIAFDGVQGAELDEMPEVRVALPFAPDGVAPTNLFSGVAHARRAAELVASVVTAGATERASVLTALRAAGPFDDHGDPIDAPVWLWQADAEWTLRPDRPLLPA